MAAIEWDFSEIQFTPNLYPVQSQVHRPTLPPLRDEMSIFHHPKFDEEQSKLGDLTADMSSLNLSMVGRSNNPRQFEGAQGGGGYLGTFISAPATNS